MVEKIINSGWVHNPKGVRWAGQGDLTKDVYKSLTSLAH